MNEWTFIKNGVVEADNNAKCLLLKFEVRSSKHKTSLTSRNSGSERGRERKDLWVISLDDEGQQDAGRRAGHFLHMYLQYVLRISHRKCCTVAIFVEEYVF